jgi:hypothetical protein
MIAVIVAETSTMAYFFNLIETPLVEVVVEVAASSFTAAAMTMTAT